MEYKKYYKVEVDKLESLLIELGKKDFEWREFRGQGSPMSKYFLNAVSRDWSGDVPIIQVEESVGVDTGKHYKFIELTSALLLGRSDPNAEVHTYQDLLQDVGLN